MLQELFDKYKADKEDRQTDYIRFALTLRKHNVPLRQELQREHETKAEDRGVFQVAALCKKRISKLLPPGA